MSSLLLRKGISRHGRPLSNCINFFESRFHEEYPRYRGCPSMIIWKGRGLAHKSMSLDHIRLFRWYACQIDGIEHELYFGIDGNLCVMHFSMKILGHIHLVDMHRTNNSNEMGIKAKIVERIAIEVISSAFLSWKWRKDHLWNPHDPIGKKWLERQAEKACEAL